MKCIHCGAESPDHAEYCISCGAEMDISDVPSEMEDYPEPAASYEDGESPVYTNFSGAIRLFFKNYFNFTGRSTRSEYWYAVLFTLITAFALAIIEVIIGGWMLLLIWRLLIFIPRLAMEFRRLHDVGKKGTLCIILEVLLLILNAADDDYMSYDDDIILFLAIVGLILSIIMLSYCCSPSDPRDNEYGRAPH